MRFRKSIRIGKGLRLNFSKSGVTATIGGRGISANIGPKGVFLNTSIPGTGLYDRKKLFDFGGGKKPAAKRAETVVPERVRLDISEDGALLVYDEADRPVTSPSVLNRLKANPEFSAACERLLRETADACNAESAAFSDIIRDSAKVGPGTGTIGDRDAAEDVLEAWLTETRLAIDFHVDFELDETEATLYIDLDLPEIEHLPAQKMAVQGNRVKLKDKTQKERREEYSRCVLGLAVYIASHCFALLPGLERVLISGYTQRRDARTGDMRDDYIYSVVFERENFEGVDLGEQGFLLGVGQFIVPAQQMGLAERFELGSGFGIVHGKGLL